VRILSKASLIKKKQMEFCMEKQLDAKVIHCSQCKSTGVLVGLNQMKSDVCVDCKYTNEMKTSSKKKN